MEGFKKLPKMQHFKTGGSVKCAPVAKCSGGKMKEGGKADIAQDKAIIKKAFAMHDKQEHKGEKTDLSKLKKGGRSKKAVGTVKKYQAGGQVTNVYEAKKSSADKENILKVKQTKPAKAAAPSKAAVAPKNTPALFKKGGKVKKCAAGGQPGATEEQQKYYNKNKAEAAKKAAEKDYEVFGSRGDAARKGMEEGRIDAMGNVYKKGGKAKKFADGGLTDEEKAWLGGADASDPFIQARMRQALGTKKTATPTPAVAKPADDLLRDETGAVATLQRNEYGDFYTPVSKMTPSAPAKPAVAVAKPVARPAALEAVPLPSGYQYNEYGDVAPTLDSMTAAPAPAKPSGLYGSRQPSFMQRFFNQSPVDQAAQFNRGVQARKDLGKRLGGFSLPNFNQALTNLGRKAGGKVKKDCK